MSHKSFEIVKEQEKQWDDSEIMSISLKKLFCADELRNDLRVMTSFEIFSIRSLKAICNFKNIFYESRINI